MEDLQWMGLHWDAGPDREDERGAYRQSRRGAIYARHSATLDARGLHVPVLLHAAELDLSRKAQLAAGRPPRYAGTCRELAPRRAGARARRAYLPTTRFRVPTGRRVEFDDMVHGPQSFATDDIGDFILRRADGSAAFFFSNAIDDAEMGITHVLRGEDHLTNTPRQLLVLEALGLRAPPYGHLSAAVGADGSPLSKRHGSVRASSPRAGLSTRGARQSPVPARPFERAGRLGVTAALARSSPSNISAARRRASRSRSSMSGSAKSRTHMPLEESEPGSRPRHPATSAAGEAPGLHRGDPRPTCCCRRMRPAGAKWSSAATRHSMTAELARVREAGPEFFRAAAGCRRHRRQPRRHRRAP